MILKLQGHKEDQHSMCPLVASNFCLNHFSDKHVFKILEGAYSWFGAPCIVESILSIVNFLLFFLLRGIFNMTYILILQIRFSILYFVFEFLRLS